MIPENRKSDSYNFIKDLTQLQNQLSPEVEKCLFFFHLIQFNFYIILYCFIRNYDNPQLNEQIITIAYKLLEYQCVSKNQHQNIFSTFK